MMSHKQKIYLCTNHFGHSKKTLFYGGKISLLSIVAFYHDSVSKIKLGFSESISWENENLLPLKWHDNNLWDLEEL